MTTLVAEVDARMQRGCLLNIPNTSCTRCGWDPGDGIWPSLGGSAVRWIQENLIFGEGDFFGQPFKLMPDQKLFLYRWYEFCPECDQWRFNEGLRMEATGGGKTQFIAAIVLLEFDGPPEIATVSPNIPIAAASWDQADLCFGQAAMMVGGRDDEITEAPLCGQYNVFDTEITFKDGRPGKIYRIAAIAGTNEGGLPSLFVCDELHEWGEMGSKKARVHAVVGKSTKKRKRFWDPNSPVKYDAYGDAYQDGRGCGRILNISTAGFMRRGTLLGTTYDRCKRILRDQTIDARYLVNIYEARPGLNFSNPEHRRIAARDASPAAGVIWSVADRVAEWGKIEDHEWIRYYANTWPEINEDSWLKDHPQLWAHSAGEWKSRPNENPWVLSVDMALNQDSVAVVRCEWLANELGQDDNPNEARVAVTARIWKASDYEGRIPHAEVWNYIKGLATGKKSAGFKGVVYDPRYFEVPARLLETEHKVRVIEFSQDASQMAPACGMTFKKMLAGQIVHDGDPDFQDHVQSAAKVPIERGGFVLKKGKSKGKIDACIAMCMGIATLHALPKTPKLMFTWA